MHDSEYFDKPTTEQMTVPADGSAGKSVDASLAVGKQGETANSKPRDAILEHAAAVVEESLVADVVNEARSKRKGLGRTVSPITRASHKR